LTLMVCWIEDTVTPTCVAIDGVWANAGEAKNARMKKALRMGIILNLGLFRFNSFRLKNDLRSYKKLGAA